IRQALELPADLGERDGEAGFGHFAALLQPASSVGECCTELRNALSEPGEVSFELLQHAWRGVCQLGWWLGGYSVPAQTRKENAGRTFRQRPPCGEWAPRASLASRFEPGRAV